MDRLRQDLEAYPANLVDWEADCLRHVANLLDSLDHARAEWGSLSNQLTTTKERLDDVLREKERLARAAERLEAAETEVEDTRAEVARLRARLGDAERERDQLSSVRTELDRASAELQDARAELETLRARVKEAAQGNAALEAAAEELETVRGELDRVRRERDTLAENHREVDVVRSEVLELRARLREAEERTERPGGDAEAADLREELERVKLERDRLAAGGEEWAASQTDLAAANERIADLERKSAELQASSEHSIVEACELRVLVNRMENERDDALRKRRKVLDKVHRELDAAGAPKGENVSFGERIRWLQQRITDLEQHSLWDQQLGDDLEPPATTGL